MKRKIFLILGFAAAVILFDKILFYFISNYILADWISVILTSFIIGILLKPVFRENPDSSMFILLPITLLVVKFILYVSSMDNPSTAIMIMIIAAYPVVSYLFIRLGTRMNFKKA